MIPYVLLQMDIDMEKEYEHLEIRVLDLMAGEVTFRLPKSIDIEKNKIDKISFNFFDFEKYGYNKIYPKEYELWENSITEDDEEKDWVKEYCKTYSFRCEEEDFIRETKNLIKQYTDYIYLKLSGDGVLSGKLVGYPYSLDASFCSSLKNFQKKLFTYSLAKCGKSPNFFDFDVDYGILLDNPCLYGMFLKYDWRDFLAEYFEKLNLTGHPIAKVYMEKSNWLYIGNSFCGRLLPEYEILNRILDKAHREKINIAIVFSKMTESEISYYEEYFNNLKNDENIKQIKEFVVNDWGMLLLINEKFIDAPVDKTDSYDKAWNIKITLGVLLNKHWKDVRMEYKKGRDDTLLSENSFNDELIKEYMEEKYNISGYMYETSGQKYDINSNSDIIFPFFQMNTGAKCTLNSVVKYGDRGRQICDDDCKMVCLEKCFVYPKHLNMAGVYNSLFGYDKEVLCDEHILGSFVKQGAKRLIFNGFVLDG